MRDAGAQTFPSPRWLAGWSAVPPVAFALVLLAIQVVGSTFAADGQPERRSLDVFAYVLLCAGPIGSSRCAGGPP